jgi:phosphohistidine phosphatase SixA
MRCPWKAKAEVRSGARNSVILAATSISQALNQRKKQMIFGKTLRVVFRSLVLIVLLATFSFPARPNVIDQPPVTLILVRHAEKQIVPPENKDPDLGPAGMARAQELARMFGDSGITAIYATQYKRTQQTVKPLAEKLGITITQIEAKQTPDLVKQIRARGAGQVIFIAGHNNTVPEIIAAMGGPQLPIIPETEYDNLYILTVQSDGSAKLLKMKYGSAVSPIGNQGMTKP